MSVVRAAKVEGATASKAAFVGANSVIGPGPGCLVMVVEELVGT